ncbi:hypothetical protein ACFQT0_17495 [Hymenobacter humi]|uniref:XRE family transcriptional regulator n=1 Tax=Hymenobacter humi TaxID=1411620 RepID=A0ABW2U800_9BACT
MAAPVPVPIDQRFAQLIQQFGLTKNSFAISLGKTASVVQHLIDGRNKPGYDLLCRVFEVYPNVSRDWLLLGRGPMLVGGELAPKPVEQAAVPAPELPSAPPDFEEIEVPPHRRSGPGVAGTRLQPAEIAATLALAAAANQPIRATPPTPVAALEAPAALAVADAPAVPVAAAEPQFSQASPTPPASAMTETAPSAPASAPSEPVPATAQPAINSAQAVMPPVYAAAPAAGPTPEIYVAAALHAQHLQHQLALSEMRNQHLLEQQQMLREMLAMARQSMV